jgi:hypothetical protein
LPDLFWVEQFIFIFSSLAVQWEGKENITRVDCGKIARRYLLARSGDYDWPMTLTWNFEMKALPGKNR